MQFNEQFAYAFNSSKAWDDVFDVLEGFFLVSFVIGYWKPICLSVASLYSITQCKMLVGRQMFSIQYLCDFYVCSRGLRSYLHTCQRDEKNSSEQTTTISIIVISPSLMFYKRNTKHSLFTARLVSCGVAVCACVYFPACVPASVCDRNPVFVISVWSLHDNEVVD